MRRAEALERHTPILDVRLKYSQIKKLRIHAILSVSWSQSGNEVGRRLSFQSQRRK